MNIHDNFYQVTKSKAARNREMGSIFEPSKI